MDILISIFIGVSLIEIYIWLPALSDWLTERAVRRLNSADQERYREDWRANLTRLPNSGLRLVHAFSLFFCARNINMDAYEDFCDMADLLIGGVLEADAEAHALHVKTRCEGAERRQKLDAKMKIFHHRIEILMDSVCKSTVAVNDQESYLNSLKKCARIVAERVHEADSLAARYEDRVKTRAYRWRAFLGTIEREHASAFRRLRRGKLPSVDPMVTICKLIANYDAFFNKEKEESDETDVILKQFAASVNSVGEAMNDFTAVADAIESLRAADFKSQTE